MNKRRVHLYGGLRGRHVDPIEVYGNTVFEIIEGLSRQLDTMQPSARGRVKISVIDFTTEEDLHRFLEADEIELHVVPQLAGNKAGVTQILVGAALIGLSFVPGVGTTIAPMLLKAGVLTMIGGVVAMLAPTPQSDTNSNESAKYLGTPRNTTKIGTRIPILYGKYRYGGHYLSFDINAVEYARG